MSVLVILTSTHHRTKHLDTKPAEANSVSEDDTEGEGLVQFLPRIVLFQAVLAAVFSCSQLLRLSAGR